MGKKITLEEAQAKLNELERNSIILDDVYISSSSKMRFKCVKCGNIWSSCYSSVRRGYLCPECAKKRVAESKIVGNSKFIERANKIHGNFYCYSKTNYKRNYKKVCIICPIHGEFWQTPSSHLNGSGCPDCNGTKKYDSKKVSEIFNSHGYYVVSEYKNSHTKIKCIDINGYLYEIRLSSLLQNKRADKFSKYNKYTIENIIVFLRNNNIKYSYISGDYKNSKSLLNFKCNDCQETFKMSFSSIKNNRGCPKCNDSNGERLISNFLDKMDIKYERNKKFSELVGVKNGLLSYDFFIENLNVLIEYNGRQHY